MVDFNQWLLNNKELITLYSQIAIPLVLAFFGWSNNCKKEKEQKIKEDLHEIEKFLDVFIFPIIKETYTEKGLEFNKNRGLQLNMFITVLEGTMPYNMFEPVIKIICNELYRLFDGYEEISEDILKSRWNVILPIIFNIIPLCQIYIRVPIHLKYWGASKVKQLVKNKVDDILKS